MLEYYLSILILSSPPGLAGVSGNHSAIAFAKSRALLGSVSGIERGRVTDLQNPDPDRALAPHFRVSNTSGI